MGSPSLGAERARGVCECVCGPVPTSPYPITPRGWGFSLRAPQSEVLQHSKPELCVKPRCPSRQGALDGAVPWTLAVPQGSEWAGWRKTFCLTISAILTCIQTLQSHLLGAASPTLLLFGSGSCTDTQGKEFLPSPPYLPRRNAAFIQGAHTVLSLGITF